MPSHIFVQRGMWEDVRTSNIVAYKAAVDLNARMKLAEGREDFHTLSWLQYANLMLGNIDEAKQNVEWAKQAADRNPTNAGIRNGYLGMRARLILETERLGKHRARVHRVHRVRRVRTMRMPACPECRCPTATSGFSSPATARAKRGDLEDRGSRRIAAAWRAREARSGPERLQRQVPSPSWRSRWARSFAMPAARKTRP